MRYANVHYAWQHALADFRSLRPDAIRICHELEQVLVLQTLWFALCEVGLDVHPANAGLDRNLVLCYYYFEHLLHHKGEYINDGKDDDTA